MPVYEYTVNLKNGVSGAAKTAANDVRGLADSMKNGLQKGMTDASGAMKGTAQQIQSTSASTMELQEELAAATGGLSVLVEAAAAVVMSLGALTLAGAAFAIECSEAKTQALALWGALGEGKISGEQVDDMLDGMRARLGITKDAMAPLATKFMQMGITSQDALEKMTTAALSAKALTGGSDAAAESFTKLSKKIQLAGETGQGLKIPLKGLGSLADMGLTVDDVAQKMGVSTSALAAQLKSGTADANKFGNALQDALISKGAEPMKAMSLTTANLGAMLKEYIGDLFEDLGPAIKPFLEQVKQLFGIFESKTTPSGQALKQGIEGFFKNVFAIATKVVPMVKHFLLDCIIFGLKVYIAMKPIVKTLKEIWEQHDGMGKLKMAFEGIKTVMTVLAVGVGVVVAAFVGLMAIGVAVSAAIWLAFEAIVEFATNAGKAISDWVSGAVTAGKDFVDGLINGIKGGATAVVDAVTSLADSAKNAFKNKLGIASPSKEMMKLGAFAGAGVAEGLDASAGDVHASASQLGASAYAGASGQGSGGGSSSGSGVTVNVEPGAIVIQGAGKGAEELTETAVALLFERVALAQGLG